MNWFNIPMLRLRMCYGNPIYAYVIVHTHKHTHTDAHEQTHTGVGSKLSALWPGRGQSPQLVTHNQAHMR